LVQKASSSIGRAAVSKTAGWGFDSLLACQEIGKLEIGNGLGSITSDIEVARFG
tara:strand:+ start:1711 stop:1872 length:162 start_codon:yes stop_codon:yes gene_type:complete